MMRHFLSKYLSQRRLFRQIETSRRGVVLALTVACLPVIFAFVAYGVDTGMITLTQTNLQNAVDAAALAASQEITGAVYDAAEDYEGEGDGVDIDANSIAVARARQVAADVAAANGVYIDPEIDVIFGKRAFNEDTGTWPISWDAEPYNVVRVTARRNHPDTDMPDGKLKLAFGWAVGVPSVTLGASASAFVDARDIILVLDFSGSMNDDSEFKALNKLGRTALEANMADIIQALQPLDLGDLPMQPAYLTVVGADPAGDPSMPQIEVTFKRTSIDVESTKDLSNVVLEFDSGDTQKFEGLSGTTGTFAGTGDYEDEVIVGAWVKSGSNASGDGPGYGERLQDSYTEVKKAFGLDSIPYPYPSGSWSSFISHCRSNYRVKTAGYQHMYGAYNFVNYLLSSKYLHTRTPDLWKTPHYPFHAIKEGTTLFCNFLTDLDFGDELGLVSYATTSRRETELNEDGYNIDISADPIIGDYQMINAMQRHKQAGHYSNMTHMGDGILKAKELLIEHARYGSRPTMLLMTDGCTNQMPSGWTQPAGWDWAALTDYDGDGNADYTTSNVKKQYAFWEAKRAIDCGITIHTMSVGTGADRNLMKAIAFAGSGIWIDVPGGATIAEMQDQMLDAFSQIAAKVPPAKLIYDDGAPAE